MGMRPSASDLTRRGFLGGLLAGSAALAAGCRRKPYDADAFPPLPALSNVALLAAPSYDEDLADIVSRGLRELRVSLQGRRVFLKPNMVEYERGTVINTNPLVVGAVAEAARRAGAAAVVVGEGPGHRRDIEHLVTATGLYDHLRDLKVPFVDLNHDDVRRVPLRSRFMGLSELALPVSLLASDFVVSLPKLKTHHWAGMTCGMKNLFGVVPGAVYGWPKNVLHFKGIENAIVDLTAAVKPSLVVVDAIVAMEGDGPIMGKPRQTGFLAMGQDPVAVDATCARAMGLDARRLPYIRHGAEFLGNADGERIAHRGEEPERFAYAFELIDSMKELREGGAL